MFKEKYIELEYQSKQVIQKAILSLACIQCDLERLRDILLVASQEMDNGMDKSLFILA